MTLSQARAANSARSWADLIAVDLVTPLDVRTRRLGRGWWPQSLAHGAAGIALLHVERACTGLGSWRLAHQWLASAAEGGVSGTDDSHLYYGAPALGFVLHAAATSQPDSYSDAFGNLDELVFTATRHRLVYAHARIDRGELATLAEFDTIRGLAGIGAHLLRRDPGGELIRAVLAYLVRLTEPINDDGDLLPGWWTAVDPGGRQSDGFPGGHANTGMAHGIGGPLALLALAASRGVTVAGQNDAIGRICSWLDYWRQDGVTGPWWPYWVTRSELRDERIERPGPSRPSWCYGTAGLARAQQLAALATGDVARQQLAEEALLHALTDPVELATITDNSLCHGYAGLIHIAGRAATDALTPQLSACVPELIHAMSGTDDGRSMRAQCQDAGLLEGATGTALAMYAVETGTQPLSGWDSCLLIN